MSLTRGAALLVAVLTLGAGCAESGRIEVGEALSPDDLAAGSSSAPTSTSTSTSTSAPTSERTETTLAGDAEPVDEDAEGVGWASTAREYRGEIGWRVAFDCPADGDPGAVWGTGPFTDDSSVCTAGAYVGVITVSDGGRVVIEIADGLDDYPGGVLNGITAESYGPWPGSFDVIG